jgi:signal peptidase II
LTENEQSDERYFERMAVTETEPEMQEPEAALEEPVNEIPPASTAGRALLFVVAALIILIDHVTKLFIESWLPLYQSWAPFPEYADYFRITHVTNTGAAFGLFPGGSAIFAVIAVVVAVIIVVYNYQLPDGQPWLRVALGFQLGGAMGNLIDRLRLGHVTDFLDFGPWPVFNVADASVVTGVIILALLMLFEQPQQDNSQPVSGAEADDQAMQSSVSTPLQARKQNEQAT